MREGRVVDQRGEEGQQDEQAERADWHERVLP